MARPTFHRSPAGCLKDEQQIAFALQQAESVALGPPAMYWKAAALSHTMTNSRREDWGRTLEAQRREVRTVLELGSYGGQSALFGASVTCTCIDYWQNFAEGCSLASEVKRHFDANLRGRAHKIKEDSPRALYSLQNSHAMFDLIYSDGDHSAHQVMVDSILAWRRLRPGGIMIWDDHREWGERPSTCFAGADIEVPPAAQ